jgi:beta-glucanase (GH16 family)
LSPGLIRRGIFGLLCASAVLLLVVAASIVDSRRSKEAVLNPSAEANLSDWHYSSDAGTMALNRVTHSNAPEGVGTAVEVSREGQSGKWALVLAGLSKPKSFFKPGRIYQMRAYVRDMNASGRSIGILLANSNFMHRPTEASQYEAFTDDSWHLLQRTFIAERQAYDDTALYFDLPASGSLRLQIMLASVQEIAVPKTPTTTSTTTTVPTSAMPKTPTTTSTTTTVPASETPKPRGLSGSWNLVFEDEFNGTSLNTSRWIALDDWSINNVQTMAANVSVANGNLVLTLASRKSGAGVSSAPYNGAGANGYLLRVGDYAEARVYFPGSSADGVYNWPAWWASGRNWPAAGEHDIAEGTHSGLTVNYHSPSGQHKKGGVPGVWFNEFHTYGVLRMAGRAEVYWDGVLVKSYTTDDNGRGQALLLNVGKSSARPAVTGRASQVKVDYVRAWRPAE